MKLIVATANQAKMKEIRAILSDLDLEVCSMAEYGIEVDIEETGTTFEENAIIKAEFIATKADAFVMADDSGLEIDFLDKQPGVYSARFLGHDTPYAIKNEKIIEMLEKAEPDQRSARFVCAIAVAVPGEKTLVTTAAFEGSIGYEQKGPNGFGYDPIFYVPEYGMTAAEMDKDLKNRVSHRAKAIEKMKLLLQDYLENHI